MSLAVATHAPEGAPQPACSFLEHQYALLGINQHMQASNITEICINRPGEIHLETPSGWRQQSVPQLTLERARQFCVATLNESNTGQRISDAQPLVSLTFPTGQRAQFVIPPACAPGELSITIRLPSTGTMTLASYRKAGYFDHVQSARAGLADEDTELLALLQRGDHVGFFQKAVQYRRNIVVAGATGSGKTTFMKSLVSLIPADERVVTIEDARELFITQQNRVHLLYSKGGQGSAAITAKTCMEACLRMRPDRIILAELRGDETFYFMRNCASGHPGTITSCHAGSTSQAWDQLALMIKASAEGSNLDYAVIKHLLHLTVDIIVHLQVHKGRRLVSAIDFDPLKRIGRAAAPC